MSDKNATRHVLMGLALLLATAAVILGVTLIWPRTHAPVTSQAPTSSEFVTPPVDLAAFLPEPSEYPPGFSVPTEDSGFARVQFSFATAGPGESVPAPCDPEGSLPAQPPAGDTTAELALTNPRAPDGATLTIMIAAAGNWKDVSAIRTRLAECPNQDNAGIKCTEVAHQPVPPVPADDVIAVESRCHGGFDFRFLTYYAVVKRQVVYLSASGDDPRPAEGVLALIVRKIREGAPSTR